MTRERSNEEILKRKHQLEYIFERMKRRSIRSDLAEHLYLNDIVLYNAIVSYFHDVDRHKEFHGSVLVDEVKQAAYLIKWIAKLRPIYFDVKLLNPSYNVLYANEIFAIRSGFSYLGVKPTTLPTKVHKEAHYTLRYRSVDERYLMLWLTHLVS